MKRFEPIADWLPSPSYVANRRPLRYGRRMGSWWNVEIGGQDAPVWGKSFVPDELMLLFGDDDYYVDSTKLQVLEDVESRATDVDDSPANWFSNVMGYSTTAGALRRRLQLQGFSSEWICRLSTAFFEDQREERHGLASWEDRSALYPNSSAITAALTTRFGRAAGAGIPPDWQTHPREHFLFEKWGELREAFDDPRFALALSLSRTRDSTQVKLDLTDLVLGGWMTGAENPHGEARSRMAAVMAADGPVIVVTEGASDARRLQRSLEISAPDVANLFTFLDFDFKPPGGTDRVVSLTKGMAAAGVMNRIVAVLDNDIAGREAKAQLLKLDLPIRVTAICLPEVPYAGSYPTLGPSGCGMENVNGRAASMEFMFGEDILRDKAGVLAPVRWQAFNERFKDYQGHLGSSDKTDVGKRIDAALSATVKTDITMQVEEGCARLATTLIAAVHIPQRIPASESSILTAMWRRDPFADIEVGP